MLPIADQDHRLLCDSAQAFLSERCTSRWVRTGPRWSESDTQLFWADTAELGWLGMLMPESDGGLDLSMKEMVIVAERAGAHLLPLPLLESAVLASSVRRLAPQLPLPVQALCEGRATLGWLHLGEEDEESLLDHHGQCTHVLVTKSLPDGGMHLGLAPVDSLTLQEVPALDPASPLGRVALEGRRRIELEAALAATLDPQSSQSLELAWRLAQLADLLGVSGAAFELTRAYVRERVQFGVAIGSFQAIKHRLADCAMALDMARLAVWDAAVQTCGNDTPAHERQLAVDHAHLAVERIAVRMRTETIQLHGGIGFTWECDAHLYQKRIIRLLAGLPSAAAVGRIADHTMQQDAA